MSRTSGRERSPRGKSKSTRNSTSQTAAGLKIGRAAELIGVKPFVLRFWETQFGFLKPRHPGSKQRSYLSEDLENLKLVKRLLHEQRFTIEGARKLIGEIGLERVRAESGFEKRRIERPTHTSKSTGATALADSRARAALAEIRRELESIRKLLRR